MRIQKKQESEKVGLNLTSAVDVVFLMLIFFIFTFRITAYEGDIQLRMPVGGLSSDLEDSFLHPIVVSIHANSDGTIQEIKVNHHSVGNDFDELKKIMVEFLGPPGPERERAMNDQRIEFHCDAELNYEETIRVVSATCGKRRTDGEIENYFKKIIFKRLN